MMSGSPVYLRPNFDFRSMTTGIKACLIGSPGLLFGMFLTDGAHANPEFNLITLAEYSHGEIDTEAANNPGNRLFELPSDQYRLDLRPRLDTHWRSFDLSLDPRLIVSRRNIKGGGVDSETDASLRYWQVNWQHRNAYLTGGRYVQLWGPSVMLSPTSRYHPDNGSVRPNTELLARDFLDFGYYFSDQWELQLIGNIGEGEQELSEFRRTGDVRLTWTGTSASVTGQISWLNPGWAEGLTAQWTVNDAVILYMDALYGDAREGAQSILSSTACGPDRVPGNLQQWESICRDSADATGQSYREDGLKAVAGMSYTFENGLNAALDYYHNEIGLSGEESEFLLSEAVVSSSRLFSEAASEGDGQIIRRVSDLPFFDLSNDYLIGRVTQPSFFKRLDGTLIYSRNLDDESSQATINIECQCSDTITFFVNASWYSGNLETEYGRFYERTWHIGLKWFY